MQILISEKYLPFSTVPGISMLIPGTTLQATFFPTRIEFNELSKSQPVLVGAITLDLHQPEYPTVQLDLEKGCIRVWGDSNQGFYRFFLTAFSKDNSLEFILDKGDFTISSEGLSLHQKEKGRFEIKINQPWTRREAPPLLEKISMGSHRKQNWSQIVRRGDLAEILPIWYHIAQWIPTRTPAVYEGTASLLPYCCQAITNEERNSVLIPFENMFRVCFEGLLSPTLFDKLYQGYLLNPVLADTDPLAMCVDGALLIRSLFVQSQGEAYKLLPVLPVSFHCGRALHFRLGDKGVLDMEWTKKQIRRAVFTSHMDGELYLQFPKEVDSFRLRHSEMESGQLFQNGDPIPVQKDSVILLDRFQK